MLTFVLIVSVFLVHKRKIEYRQKHCFMTHCSQTYSPFELLQLLLLLTELEENDQVISCLAQKLQDTINGRVKKTS